MNPPNTPKHCSIEELFKEHLFPRISASWKFDGEGVLVIVSRVFTGVSCPAKNLATTREQEIVLEGFENSKFWISREAVMHYPNPESVKSTCSDGTDVIACVLEQLLQTWKTTGHGRLRIKSQKYRKGKIEVLVGETTSFRFFVDPTQLKNP